MTRIPVTVLGATGVVGQRIVRRLIGHPRFELQTLAASERSAGRRYGDAVHWAETEGLPPLELVVRGTTQRYKSPV